MKVDISILLHQTAKMPAEVTLSFNFQINNLYYVKKNIHGAEEKISLQRQYMIYALKKSYLNKLTETLLLQLSSLKMKKCRGKGKR